MCCNNAYINLLTFNYANIHTHNSNYALHLSTKTNTNAGKDGAFSSRSAMVGDSRFCSRCTLQDSSNICQAALLFLCASACVCVYVGVIMCATIHMYIDRLKDYQMPLQHAMSDLKFKLICCRAAMKVSCLHTHKTHSNTLKHTQTHTDTLCKSVCKYILAH